MFKVICDLTVLSKINSNVTLVDVDELIKELCSFLDESHLSLLVVQIDVLGFFSNLNFFFLLGLKPTSVFGDAIYFLFVGS